MKTHGRTIRRRERESGTVMFLGTLMLLFIVLPAVGLAIDGGVAFAVKARLQTATDGAALAAARSLSRGISLGEQRTNAEATAREFFDANMLWSWNALQNPSRLVSWPAAPPKTTIVKLDTAIDAPTYFLKVMGYNSLRIRAAGQANRRDVNIMMVVDRSKSLDLSNSCTPLKVAARSFVDQFADGRDRLGLLTFGTTFRVDFAPAFNFRSASTNITTRINAIDCSGYTNAAAGYWNGWKELETLNEANTLNVILFFTDGKPNTVTLDKLDVKPGAKSSGGSGCIDKTRKTGAVVGKPLPSLPYTYGIFNWIETSNPPVNDPDWTLIPNSAGCYYASNNDEVDRDIIALHPYDPGNERDKFGNLLTGYKLPLNRDGSNRLRIDDNGDTVESAGHNALHDAAKRVRTISTGTGLDVYTYAIALGGAGAPEDALMKRVANTTDSVGYDSSKPTGLYIYAANATQLEQAFNQLASDILRISQ